VRETVSTARELNKPYAVVINAAPVKREDQEAPAVALSRAQFVPFWSGQISQRAAAPASSIRLPEDCRTAANEATVADMSRPSLGH